MNDLAELCVSATAEKPEIAGAVCRINVATADVARTFETRARVAVVATFANGYVARTSLMPRRGVHILPLRVEACEGAGIRPGDSVTVTLREDRKPRTLESPHDLIAALNDARLCETFDAMSYSHRKEWISAIADAKRPETRTKRIRECLAAMGERAAR
jgi:hypothetical protein